MEPWEDDDFRAIEPWEDDDFRAIEPWEDDDFRAIEEAGDVQLNEPQRQALEAEIATYVTALRHRELTVRDDADRKWLEAAIKSLNKAIQTLELPSMVKFKVFSKARLLSGDAKMRSSHNEIARLKAIRDSAVEMRKKLGQRGRKLNSRLPGLLRQLEVIFREAGGIILVSRTSPDVDRESRFFDFAWEALVLHVPEHMRPSNRGGLAIFWERYRQKPK